MSSISQLFSWLNAQMLKMTWLSDLVKALVVDEKVKVMGRVATAEEIKKMLTTC